MSVALASQNAFVQEQSLFPLKLKSALVLIMFPLSSRPILLEVSGLHRKAKQFLLKRAAVAVVRAKFSMTAKTMNA